MTTEDPTNPEGLIQGAYEKLALHIEAHPYRQVLRHHAQPVVGAIIAPERGPAGSCYENALRCAIAQPNMYTYCEGLAFVPKFGLWFEHAWVVDSSGLLVECTWQDAERVIYLGLEFTLDALCDVPDEADSVVPAIWSDWSRDMVLLRRHSECCVSEGPG